MVDEGNVIPFPGQWRPGDDEMRSLADGLIEQTGSPQEALGALMGLLGVAPAGGAFGRRRPVLLPRREKRAAFVVRVDLDDAKPPIWRRLRLASDLTLDQLHDLLQVAMGWTDSHLHHFVMGPKARDWVTEPFLSPYDVTEGEEGITEAAVRVDEVLAVPGDRLFYEYDFGDGWQHTIRLEKVDGWPDGAPDCLCLAGRRACPPEDVGGVGGYDEMLEALAGRIEPEGADWIAEKLAWMPDDFDPAAFSVTETNEALATAVLPDLTGWHPAIVDLLESAGGSAMSATAELVKRATVGPWELDEAQTAAAVRRYRHLLATVGEGITLTAAGYLPPRFVESLYRGLGMSERWMGKGNREDQTYPVLTLRESATALGLLRKNRGRLLPTKVGVQLADDPLGLLTHVASRLPLGRPHERDAGLLALLSTAAGTRWRDAGAEAVALMADLGWRAQGGSGEQAALQWAWPTMEVFDHLVGKDANAERRALVARAILHRA